MPDLATLSNQYQRDQDNVAKQVLAWLTSWWVGVSADPQNLQNPDRLFDEYSAKVVAARTESIRTAQTFYNDLRGNADLGKLPPSKLSTVRADSPDVGKAFFPLMNQAKGRLDDPDFLSELDRLVLGPLRENTDTATLRAGRDTVEGTQDTDVIGYYRKTDANPCGFCAMLASRGLVYTADRNASKATRSYLDDQNLDQYHASCRCQTLPLFEDTSMPTADRALADKYKALWRATDGSGAAQLANYSAAIAALHEES